MDKKEVRPVAPAKPARDSIKAIQQTNIVNRRTQLFEVGKGSNVESSEGTVKTSPPQRPAPPSKTQVKVNFPGKSSTTQQQTVEECGAKNEDDSKMPANTNVVRNMAKPKPPKPVKPTLISSDDKGNESPSRHPSNVVSQMKIFETDQIQKSSNDQVVENKPPNVMPAYSKIDKSKKKPKSKVDEKSESSVVSAPLKPPRTFEHDRYLERKAIKKALKHKGSHVPSKYDVSDKVKEESEDVNGSDNIFESVRFKNAPVANKQNLYEEISEPKHIYEEVKNKSGGDNGNNKPERPQPPPRPPNPKVSTLSGSPHYQRVYDKRSSDPENFVKTKSISNPGYEKKHEIIPIRTYFHDNGETGLKRHHSDECLYESNNALNESSDGEPIYQDPADALHKSRLHKHVVIDAEGYAIPDLHQGAVSPARNNGVRKGNRISRTLASHSFRKRAPSVRDKVSEAYSILRRRAVQDETDSSKSAMECLPEKDDEDSDVDLEEHEKKLNYISTVKGKQYATLNWIYASGQQQHLQPRQLFDLGLIATVTKDPDTNKYRPTVIHHFPHQCVHKPEVVVDFCFPDAASLRPVTKFNSETYSFILTSMDGTKHYGYCRRYLPPGTGNRLPEVCCVVSAMSSFPFYRQLVERLEVKRNESLDNCISLLEASYGRPLPKPGAEAWIRCHDAEDDKFETVILKRPADCKLQRVSFSNLMDHLSVDMIIKVFSAMVLERRLLFTAQHLSTLSTCIHAVSALLYPYEWQHTFIPVLPANMIDVVCAPTPYIIGLLSTSIPNIQNLPMDEVLIIDLDNDYLCRSEGDEAYILPAKLQKALSAVLKSNMDISGSKDEMVFEAFLRLFVETTGHYTEYVCTQQDGKTVFEKEAFCKAVSSKSVRLFLEWFTETQMFDMFITNKLENNRNHTTDTFDRRIVEYREEMSAIQLSLRQNVKQLGRRMMNFVMESGGKIKKAFSADNHVFI